ncbi:MAG TPA: hypothetical protein PLI59_04475 [Candidatus Obscuribacter sp.]|nr:hypothetical protein [Candidatus Obscuribacter sp.]
MLTLAIASQWRWLKSLCAGEMRFVGKPFGLKSENGYLELKRKLSREARESFESNLKRCIVNLWMHRLSAVSQLAERTSGTGKKAAPEAFLKEKKKSGLW